MSYSGTVNRVTLEPGNSTRYDLLIIRLAPAGCQHILVILYKNRERIGGRAMKFSTVSTHCTYKPTTVSKTMGCDITEAAVILAYLRTEYDITVDLAEDFNQDTGVWGGHTIH